MAQDIEPNDVIENAVGTVPLGPFGYAVDTLYGNVYSDRYISEDDGDWYKVNHTGSVASINVSSAGAWYTKQTDAVFEYHELKIESSSRIFTLFFIFW